MTSINCVPEELKHVLFTLVESTILFLRLMCVQIYDCASLAQACNMTISVEHEELGYQLHPAEALYSVCFGSIAEGT